MKKTSTSQTISQLCTIFDKNFARPIAKMYKVYARPMQINVMLSIGNNSYIMTELSKKTYVPKQQLTIVVDRLVKKGLIKREFDEKDRRVIRISLTEAGFKWVDTLKSHQLDLISDKLDLLDKESFNALNDAANEIWKILQKIPHED